MSTSLLGANGNYLNGTGSGTPSGSHGLTQLDAFTLTAASKLSLEDDVRRLLDSGADVNEREADTGRTALWYACDNGQSNLVDMLLSSRADPGVADHLSWLPVERAAYKGHEGIVSRLKPLTATSNPGNAPALKQPPGEAVTPIVNDGVNVTHRSHVIVDLGSLHGSTIQSPLELDAGLTDSGPLSLDISASEGSGTARSISLHGIGSGNDESLVFLSESPESLKLSFKLYQTAGGAREMVGGAVAVVGQLCHKTGTDLENVGRQHKLALHDGRSFEYVGTLTFNLLVVKPFTGQHAAPAKPVPWEFRGGIGGHRGHGQNKSAWKFLQMGENSIESFRKAHDHGAAFVEFDVQVTRDRVPVIYHDFIVSETGVHSPVHMLDYDQFSFVSETQYPQDHSKKQRSQSFGTDHEARLGDFTDRMSRTMEYRMNGVKPNTRGRYIQERFTTLEECCKKLDTDIPFNIEIKYPMFFETEYWKMDPNFLEINLFVDAILDKVYECGSNRAIMFSSFCPEICIALRLKQTTYPVFFLNDGRAPAGDRRASSLHTAVRFARRWGLTGIVLQSGPYVDCPRLVQYVKSFGLATATYGSRNNDPEAVQTQFDAGVDGIIVDRVNLITQKTRRR